MRDYWITTHWPTPDVDPGQSRHVFVKQHNVSVPKPGDFIFFRQSETATVDGKRVKQVVWHHHGPRGRFDVPKGSGGIIGTGTVCGTRRPIAPEDSVFDFGDLREWSVIPCEGFEDGFLSLDDLVGLLNRKSVRHLSLWRVPDESLALRILDAVRRELAIDRQLTSRDV
jgi:hypothetical protein